MNLKRLQQPRLPEGVADNSHLLPASEAFTDPKHFDLFNSALSWERSFANATAATDLQQRLSVPGVSPTVVR